MSRAWAVNSKCLHAPQVYYAMIVLLQHASKVELSDLLGDTIMYTSSQWHQRAVSLEKGEAATRLKHFKKHCQYSAALSLQRSVCVQMAH